MARQPLFALPSNRKRGERKNSNSMKKTILTFIAVWAAGICLKSPVWAASENGSAGLMPAFYDDQLFNINFKELPAGGEAATLARNSSINIIYMSDGGLPGGAPFISVLDAIQGDGFNPLWIEVQITFNRGHIPRQLTSDVDVEHAAASGEITLTMTDEVYRCSVVGVRNK